MLGSAGALSRAPRFPGRATYARLPLLTAFDAVDAAARTFASARLATCFDAFWNWSNAAVVAANVDLNAFTAMSEPAGADLLAWSTHCATPFWYTPIASSASAE